MYEFASDMITQREMDRINLSKRIGIYATVHTLPKMSPVGIFLTFISAVDDLITMSAEDYADRSNGHYEWTMEECWERMHPAYKEQILAVLPDIMQNRYWGRIHEYEIPFREFKLNVLHRLTPTEKAEIITRARCRQMKEELIMTAMHPDRIGRLIRTHGYSVIHTF